VLTMKRTPGGSSVGSQCSAPAGMPSPFRAKMPSMTTTMRAGVYFLAAAARKRLSDQISLSSEAGTCSMQQECDVQFVVLK
jgi:hypothetical protein